MGGQNREPNSDSGYTEQGRMVADHWATRTITYEGALELLLTQGIDPGSVTAEDLHSLDMNHMGGLAATDTIAELAELTAGQKVLDVGCGPGGPARRMADKYGAQVWGIDLSEEVCHTALQFTELVGLQDRVQFKQGSGLSLQFETDEFDTVVMQHVAMQISEKERLWGECARVIKPGGRLALHEIFSGETGPPHFPLAWATDPEMSALESLDSCSAKLARLGFQVGPFTDLSEEGRKFHQVNINAYEEALSRQEGAGGLSAEVTDLRLKTSRSMERNLREGRLRVGMFVSQLSGI